VKPPSGLASGSGGTIVLGPGSIPTVNFASPDGGFTWIVTFSGTGVNLSKSIADGVYDLTLTSAAVTFNNSGATLFRNNRTPSGDPNNTDTFYRAYGDVNGDRRINNTDLNRMSQTFGKQSGDLGYLAYLDFNGDGRVNNTDLNQLSARFGTSLVSGFTPTI
jgi:hypothetical protein